MRNENNEIPKEFVDILDNDFIKLIYKIIDLKVDLVKKINFFMILAEKILEAAMFPYPEKINKENLVTFYWRMEENIENIAKLKGRYEND